MFAAPCRILACAALAIAQPAPAFASPYTDTVETAVFNLCPALSGGQISPDRPAALTRHGYRRRPGVEEDWSDAEDGAPFVFTRGRGAEAVTLGYWPGPQICSVAFGGRQASAAAARVRARLARAPLAYRRMAASHALWEDGRREAWLVAGRVPMCLSIDTPGREPEPGSYEIMSEPFPPLHPAMDISACASDRVR